RLHKFFQLSPLIKTTTFPKQLAHQPTIPINPQPPNPTSHLKLHHQLTIPFPQKLLTLKLNQLKQTTKKQHPPNIYTILPQHKLKPQQP
ncbi:RNA-binding S4 domain-containing protein, partial [Bacillus mycoides]|uniref:RNA-binding S4 domain-containing protein n=1 Tax=Bacillus mycoides TaxID=1405 RepID=UPI001C92D15F